MIPFARMMNYGNRPPLTDRIVDYYVSENNTPGIQVFLLENKQIWINGTGSYTGMGDTLYHNGGPYLSLSNVNRIFPFNYGIIALTDDNKIMFTGIRRLFDGVAGSYASWTDMTSYYTPYFAVTDIKKMAANNSSIMILLNNGDVYIHGQNLAGEFGNGTAAGTASYTPIKILETVDDIWITNANSIYRRARNYFAAGTNTYYQLGDTSTGSTILFKQIFATASADSTFEINALRVSDMHFILYSTGTRFYAQGRNSYGSWGVGSVSIDANNVSYAGTLSFTPSPKLSSFYKYNQAYWTNLIINNSGALLIAGTYNGAGSPSLSTNTFTSSYTSGVGDASGYRSGTSVRFYSICDVTSDNFVWARGSTSITSFDYGFTPLSTPLKETWTHITDFKFGG